MEQRVGRVMLTAVRGREELRVGAATTFAWMASVTVVAVGG